MNWTRLLRKIAEWRQNRISDRNFLIVASILIGTVVGVVALMLKITVHHIEHTLQDIQDSGKGVLFFLFPVIGILLTVFYVQRFRRGKLGRGVDQILYAVLRKGGLVERDKMYSHWISSALTVGFGGSAGLEAPIVVTGSAIGSNIATELGLGRQQRTVLLAAGAAAGIAAVFNCPIGGVIFAVEVLLVEFSIPVFIPLLIAAATASVWSEILYKDRLFYLVTQDWEVSSIPFYALLGLVTGLVSVYKARVIYYAENFFAKQRHPWTKALVGGLVLGGLIFLLPPLYGEGYITIKHLFEGDVSFILVNSPFQHLMHKDWALVIFLILIILLKVFATMLTTGAGGNGGIFAPSLFTGALTGFAFAFVLNLSDLVQLNTANFVAAGMAGVLSGVIHAPLTGIFLIAEITGGYSLFVPLMIVSALSFFLARYFEPFSVYTKRLARKGIWADNARDSAVLSHMRIADMVEHDFIPVGPKDTLGQLVGVVASSKRNLFPVLEPDGRLVGVVLLDDIRTIMFRRNQYDLMRVEELMTQPPAALDIHEPMQQVMQKFEQTHAWNLPVLQQGRYQGFVSKSAVFSRYRELLLEQIDKHE
jgi:CIC family chloride channel protein